MTESEEPQNDLPDESSRNEANRLPKSRADDESIPDPGAVEPSRSYVRPGSERISANGLVASEMALSATWLIFSFIIVYWICRTLDLEAMTWVVISLWILSGLATLWSEADRVLARWLLDLRQPTMVELQRMGAPWMAAARRTGIPPERYSLWVEDSKNVNATITVGYTIAVTHWSIHTLPPALLEAVVAKEVMTHGRGRTWISRLAAWYSIPARLAALAVRLLLKLSRAVPAVGWTLLCFLLIAYLGLVLVAFVFRDDERFEVTLFLTPLLAPLILLFLRRWNERAADRAAADLGYGRQLIEVFYGWQRRKQADSSSLSDNQYMADNSAMAVRIRALEVYMQQQRR